jgi:hypothetical protein
MNNFKKTKLARAYDLNEIETIVKQAWVHGAYNTDKDGNPTHEFYSTSDESYWKQIKEKLNLKL